MVSIEEREEVLRVIYERRQAIEREEAAKKAPQTVASITAEQAKAIDAVRNWQRKNEKMAGLQSGSTDEFCLVEFRLNAALSEPVDKLDLVKPPIAPAKIVPADSHPLLGKATQFFHTIAEKVFNKSHTVVRYPHAGTS